MTTKASPDEPGMRPISEVARELGISPDHLEPYGRDKAKVRLEALDRASAFLRRNLAATERLGAA